MYRFYIEFFGKRTGLIVDYIIDAPNYGCSIAMAFDRFKTDGFKEDLISKVSSTLW